MFDETTIHSTQSFIDEVTGEAPDETTIHSTQSFIDEVTDECLMKRQFIQHNHSTQSFNTIIHR